jgi:PD-(D/E)XK nuclease superfamily
VRLPVSYKGLRLDCGYRMDLVVENQVIVEIKAIDEVLPIHTMQLLTYLKASGKRVGLLINFNVPVLKKGLKRVVNHYTTAREEQTPEPSAGPTLNSSQRVSPRLRVSAVKESCVSAVKESRVSAVNKEAR